ncbi:LOW QUALITY PROTEIN: uncharacterized protein LOC116429044 [Nomia melanderi]|uniref:LOW QUALITY PROTEIN: uncharacterized protein LOC116429044 n=1 Tax=Nomia melanderi TaxID=2448451 RepID=UPI0013042C4C|nr:LOW QUALITY PROTEIN: GATA zinc finger domain-containing protein 14-like [Nomia melanderi]
MDSTDKDLKQKYDVEQMAVIGKMHNMQWLKSNSQLSGHTNVFPHEKELISNLLKTKSTEEIQQSINVVSNEDVWNNPELKNNDCIMSENIDNNNIITNNNTLESTLKVIELSDKSIMETAWNEDVNINSTLFPNSQSLVVQRLDKQEAMNMNLQENIVTVQLEHLRLKEEEKSKSEESYNESSNKWDPIHRSIPDSTKSDTDEGNRVTSKQCHDNNNNNAKSKAQPTSESKRGMQKATTKININKSNDQKIKKQSGSNVKESWTVTKQSSKDQDDSLNLYKSDKTSTSSTDSRKISVPAMSKFHDKCSKVNGYNRQLIMGKGTQMKEQQFSKQHFSTFNECGSRSKSMEGLDEKNKSQKKSNEVDEIRKSHKVQITRTQSHNNQYNRNKASIKSQQQYVRDTTKLEEENSINHVSGFNNNISATNSTENGSKKKYEISKKISDTRLTRGTKQRNVNDFYVSECSMNERMIGKSSGSVSCRRSYQNLSHTKTTTDRNLKDDQGCIQKNKKDSHVYRRSSGTFQTFFKDSSGKEKPDDYKKYVTDNSTKDYKINQFDGSKVTVYSHKAANGASNTKTDTSDSTTVNNVQSIKSLNSCSNSTKDPAIVNAPVHISQESQILQASCNGTEVQFAKTEQDHTSINNSSKMSTGNPEAKSVKFSDNVQEVNTVHSVSSSSHPHNIIQSHKITGNSYYSDLQTLPNLSNTQQMENHQSVQSKSYFDNANAQYANAPVAIQNSERNLYLLDVAHQQKPDQVSHVSPQGVSAHNNCNPVMPMGNGLPYHNMSPVYLNQYSNAQNVPRKTAENTIVSHSALVPSTSSYTMENQNIMQGEPSNILMHNTQTSVLPPSGYQNHPVLAQHNQWNLSLPDMLLFGNVMNSAHPLNMQMQNSRHVCGTDFNNIQQAGYMQPPLFYVPQLCMQGWNPMVQYPAPLYQNSPFTNCNTYPNQVLPSNTTTDTINCSAPTSMQNNPYKQFQQMQQLESNPTFTVPMKLDNYLGNMQGSKSNVRMKDNGMDVHARAGQYRVPLANEYQNCTQDGQVTVPFSYGVTMDSVVRNGQANMHMQLNQKYAPRATGNYQRMPEPCSVFLNNQEPGNRKDDVSKNDSDCIPPMVSPRECMYYGVNYARKQDNIQSPSLHSEAKQIAYMASINSSPYVPQFHKNGSYHASPKELASRATLGRGIRKSMDQ